MKNGSTFFLLLLFFACTQEAQVIVLTNELDIEQEDAPVIVSRYQLKNIRNKWPVVKDKEGAVIPSQLDDLDGDGEWDELVAVYSLQPRQQAELKVEWVEQRPEYVKRTNIRFGKMTQPGKVEELASDWHDKYNLPRGKGYPYQMDGVAWENDKVGFRHYFDGRNCRDVFGKRVADMVLDTVGIKPDGCPGDTYHVLQEWGRDILSVATSFGPGGLAIQKGDSLIRLGVTVGQTTDNVDTTRFSVVAEGPVRSIFALDFIGWDVDGFKVNVHQRITIWAGSYAYENRITTSELPDGCSLVTGLVRNNNHQPLVEKSWGNKIRGMITHDRQSYNKEYYMGMALLISEKQVEEVYDIPGKGKGIDYTWCVRMKPGNRNEYLYKVYATWELQDQRFADRDYFVSLMDKEARKMIYPCLSQQIRKGER